jgi:hypothetical protein
MGYVWRRDTNGDVGRLDGGEGERRAGEEEERKRRGEKEKRREREERPASEGGRYRRVEVSGRGG